ncbi:MAG: hypothetical protein FGF48_02520 [Candidatus Brockarchaeota archaeon]|nr:hypothetical protein [Candidatus Brockarchaeota archaeon]
MGRAIGLILALALFSILLDSLNSYASPFEFSYDDGYAEYGWSDFNPLCGDGQVHTPFGELEDNGDKASRYMLAQGSCPSLLRSNLGQWFKR